MIRNENESGKLSQAQAIIEKLVKIPRRKSGFVRNRHNNKIFRMSDGIPIRGGYAFRFNGLIYEYSTLELGIKSQPAKKMISCPAALNIERTTKQEQILLWENAKKIFKKNILKKPTVYGNHRN